MLKWRWTLGFLSLLAAARPQPAEAIPLFAHQYDVTCGKCHSVIPHLNEFGAGFLANGDRIPGVQPGPVVPISGKLNLVDSSEHQGNGPDGSGLPKAIVDEIELFAAGAIGSRASYLFEQYVVDGGEPGQIRDAWVTNRLNPWSARIPVFVQGGSFTLPLPVDPETFRDTYQNYTPYVQTVGENPFNFFDSKMGLRMQFGDSQRGLSLQLFGGPGYDRQSALPKTGVDTMLYAQDAMGPFTLSAFRYDGLRLLSGAISDRFERTGYGFTYGQWSRLSSEFVLETGWDSDCAAPGHTGCSSSGGFEQLRYELTRRLFAEARYEGTNDPSGFERDAVVLLGYGSSENSRATIEDVIAHSPLMRNTMNAQFSIAY